MSVPGYACRECHQQVHHKLSCSVVRYQGRVVVEPGDEASHGFVESAPMSHPVPCFCPHEDYCGALGWSSVCGYTGGICAYDPYPDDTTKEAS